MIVAHVLRLALQPDFPSSFIWRGSVHVTRLSVEWTVTCVQTCTCLIDVCGMLGRRAVCDLKCLMPVGCLQLKSKHGSPGRAPEFCLLCSQMIQPGLEIFHPFAVQPSSSLTNGICQDCSIDVFQSLSFKSQDLLLVSQMSLWYSGRLSYIESV